MENWKIGKLENWKIGKLENWKIGKLENWKIGKLENWKIGELENWRIGELSNAECEIVISKWLTELDLHQVTLLYNKDIELSFSKDSSDAIKKRYHKLKPGGCNSFAVYSSTNGQ